MYTIFRGCDTRKQLSFNTKIFKETPKDFGGNKSHAKTKRPVTTKTPMHVTLRASMAKNAYSFLNKNHVTQIKNAINRQARINHVMLYNFAINSNHLHFLIKPLSREACNKFIRAISGIIARIILESEKGKAKLGEAIKKFWDASPYSKIVNWGKHYFNTFYYIVENDLEAGGFIKYRNRKNNSNKYLQTKSMFH